MNKGTQIRVITTNGPVRGEFVSAKSGWVTYLTRDGAIRKARASKVEAVDATAMAPLKTARVAYTQQKLDDGRRTIHCGDEVATALLGLAPDQVVDLAAELVRADAATRWQHLNPGQRRMNASNVIRGAIRRGDLVPADLTAAAAELERVEVAA